MLKGKFVTLRIIERQDIEIVRNWRNHPDNYNYFANRDFITEIQQENWFNKNTSNRNSLRMMIIDNLTGLPIGITHLEDIDHRNRNASWGIYIADLKYRKRIFATEAVLLLFNYAFDYLNLLKIYGTTLPANNKGRSFHEFVGFQEEAVFQKHVYADGQYLDLIWIALFEEEWRTKHFNELTKFVESFSKNGIA